MMESTTTTTEARKHNHCEAFMHMQYASSNSNKRICLYIWNSRDGVTPFTMYCKEYAVELQHVNWRQDIYDPEYKPKKGDLIWRDYTPEEAAELGRKEIERWLLEKKKYEMMSDEEFKAKYPKMYCDRIPMIEQLAEMTKDPEAHIKKTAEQIIIDGSPFFELVKENWR